MQDANEGPATPGSHFAAVVVAAIVLGLLFLFISAAPEDGDEAGPAKPDISNLPVFNTASRGGQTGRIALLEDYLASGQGLDTFITDRLFTPQLLPSESYASPGDQLAASAFLNAISQYPTAYDLESFGKAAMDLAMKPGQPGDANHQQIVEQFSRVPGGDHIVAAMGNQALLMEFTRLTTTQTEKLKAAEIIARFAAIYRNEWKWSDGPGEVIAPGTEVVPEREILRRIVRLWELDGIRWLACYAGNTTVSRVVSSVPQAATQPPFANALNAVLDPRHRRFHTAAAFWPNNNPEGENSPTQFKTLLAINPEGPVAMVEFAGALPPAKLYTDWVAEADTEKARAKLLGEDFDPQRRVLLRVADLPAPSAPATPVELPALEIESQPDGTRLIRIPPLSQPTVLLLGETVATTGSVRLNDSPTTVIPANLSAGALLLSASSNPQVVALTAGAAKGGATVKAILLIALGLLVVFVVRSRRKPTPAA